MVVYCYSYIPLPTHPIAQVSSPPPNHTCHNDRSPDRSTPLLNRHNPGNHPLRSAPLASPRTHLRNCRDYIIWDTFFLLENPLVMWKKYAKLSSLNIFLHKTPFSAFLLGWVDIGFRIVIKLGYTGTPITLKNDIKNEIYFITFFRAAILLSCGKWFHPS